MRSFPRRRERRGKWEQRSLLGNDKKGQSGCLCQTVSQLLADNRLDIHLELPPRDVRMVGLACASEWSSSLVSVDTGDDAAPSATRAGQQGRKGEGGIRVRKHRATPFSYVIDRA